MFTEHTIDTAPAASRRAMEATRAKFGFVPVPVARLAESPHLLDGFLKLSGIFESTTLDMTARETVIMTVAVRNGCHVCVEMHAAKLGDHPELVAALREQRTLPEERLEAVRQFTLTVLATSGAVDDEALSAFLAHGYTKQNALEVVLGIGTYTMSTLANRLTRA
ncbi:carboxymuconolactone decarboxylase family protein [Allokutzneria sp. A3M-2-11 16]|uniref:carboxymuconolactone decarboxylase family protein n=1 Tax=Allokutzneria sp. A3M-2-11 16 TaxID=2962043 RepID=UPI0020B67933|nr:carboxymuconolactone decarboxylase family protein [Allokutzneria sp. A3M-2-11 16]MCP3801666.1 carboxymuconolactone decarboxylase family protein [Allokutzneria sp. A3M-2-11 16]